MAICKDCLHYESCYAFSKIINAARDVEKGCEYYKDRTQFVELPCKVGDTVYELYEEEHETFTGKCRRCDTDCSSYDICWHYEYEWKIRKRTVDRRYLFENWDRFGTEVFLTKEEAEAALPDAERSAGI